MWRAPAWTAHQHGKHYCSKLAGCPAGNLLQALADIQFGASERAVRINSVQSGLAEEDLAAVLTGPSLPDALVVPKASVLLFR